MRLESFFPLREDTHSVDPEWVRSMIRQYDPGVGDVLNRIGTRGLVIRGGNGTVWKITDSSIEVERAEAIQGKRTETLLPILMVVRLDQQHPDHGSDFDYVEGDLCLIRSELLQDLDPATREVIETMRQELHHGSSSRERPGGRDLSREREEFEDWMDRCRAECQMFGIDDPDILGGEDNVKIDRHGNLRLIDIG